MLTRGQKRAERLVKRLAERSAAKAQRATTRSMKYAFRTDTIKHKIKPINTNAQDSWFFVYPSQGCYPDTANLHSVTPKTRRAQALKKEHLEWLESVIKK
jgi:hypothetical protein